MSGAPLHVTMKINKIHNDKERKIKSIKNNE